VILDALEHLRRGRTTFMSAHRLSTLRSVDRILVLDHGRLVESGTHHDLIQHSGLYRTLHDVQRSHGARFHDLRVPSGSLRVHPEPIESTADGLGAATLVWSTSGCRHVEVRVGAPDGPLFAAVEQDPDARSSYERETGAWVGDGMRFFLQDVTDGRPGRTVAEATARVLVFANAEAPS
jgi:hypothetical protein